MSWLRKQSIASFQVLNPSWETVVIDGSGIPIEPRTSFETVLRSDWARYRELSLNGGFYFDTDIVFCKSIPDYWLEHDLILPIGEDQVVAHVAALGSSKGNRWFSMLDDACEQSYRPGNVYSYQFFGIQLANRMSFGLRGSDTQWIGPESFMPVPWDLTQKLWDGGESLSPLTFGVHWYGGDRLSMSLEDRIDSSFMAESKSLVAAAWRKSLGSK